MTARSAASFGPSIPSARLYETSAPSGSRLALSASPRVTWSAAVMTLGFCESRAGGTPLRRLGSSSDGGGGAMLPDLGGGAMLAGLIADGGGGVMLAGLGGGGGSDV